jgi:hypothetical protein
MGFNSGLKGLNSIVLCKKTENSCEANI